MKNLLQSGCVALSLLAAGAALSGAVAAESAATAAPPYAIDKMSFVKMVASSNEFEIASSKLAEEKTPDADVQEFAAAMIKDHSAAAEAMKKAGGTVEEAAPALSPKHAAMIKTLEGADGSEFQALYIDMQTVAHYEAVTLFATFAKGGDDPALKAFAAETLPKLQEHKTHVLHLVAAH